MVSKESIAVKGTLLETSYGLVENENISSKWLSLHCILFITSVITGLVYYCYFSFAHVQMEDTCIVNVKIVFKQSNPDIIDDAASTWGTPSDCDFCSYTVLVYALLALMFLVYFIMSGKGGRGSAGFLAQPWRIVMATLFFSLLAFTFTFAAAWLTYYGRNSFCSQIAYHNLTHSQNVTEDVRLANLHYKLIKLAGCKHVYFENKLVVSPFPSYLFIAEISGLLNTFSWLAQFVLVMVRFLVMPDFRLLRYDFILESGGKQRRYSSDPSDSSHNWPLAEDRLPVPGSAHSSNSALSTAQTALTSLDQQSLKQRESSEEDYP